MIIGTVEDLGLVSQARDDLILSIKRDHKAQGHSIAEHEGQWVGRLRRIGAAKLRHWGLSGLVGDAKLAISELVTNALLHGTGDEVAFRFLLCADVLALEVEDGSPERARINTASPEDENGRGMFLVSAVATLCGVSPDGTTTWCIFTIPPRRSR